MNKFVYKPIFISTHSELLDFVKKNPHIEIIDAFERQLKELYIIENTQDLPEDKKAIFRSTSFKKFRKSKLGDYVYIYYPWNCTLVKSVKNEEYFILKTNRNKDLITSEEQQLLRKFKVAVFGMSVGSNIAYVLTQAGISESITIADFDQLDTTNLNRIWAGVHQVGLNKCVIASRRIYEDNPFAKVKILPHGVSPKNLETLLKAKKIDCVVEEIDQMKMKIEIRKLAMKYKVPVLMITDNGDWGVLHIERYDLAYNKIFDKTPSYWDKKLINYRGKKDFANIVINQIVGGPDKVDPRMLKSAEKVGKKELVSWPQLGSAALLGGIAVTVAIKAILRNEDKEKFSRTYLYPISKK